MIKHFLLADDDEDDRELFREAFSEIDPSIICNCVNDGRGVLEKLERKELSGTSIIFLDINMPRVDGWECLAKIKNEPAFSHIPVIMYSTSSSIKDKDKALNMGAAAFITKPGSFKQLKQVLTEVTADFGEG